MGLKKLKKYNMEKVFWKIDYIEDECLNCGTVNKVKGDGNELEEQVEYGFVKIIYNCRKCGFKTELEIDLEHHANPL